MKKIINKHTFVLISVLILGAALRFYKISENIYFDGELGHNYLAIKNFFASETIPLLGPPTSHPWLFFGPLYYWIFGPVLKFTQFNPIAGSYFFAGIGVLTILINYIVISKLINRNIGIVSSLFIALSPQWLLLTRQSRFFSLVIPFFYIFLYFLVKSLHKDSRYLFIAGFFLGILLNFHLSSLILIPSIIVLVFMYHKRITLLNVAGGIVGMVIPQIPFIIHDSQNNYIMLTNLALWIPYRLLGFVGLYPKNTVNAEVINSNIESLFHFINSSFMPDVNGLSHVLFFIIVFFIFLMLKYQTDKKQRNPVWITLLVIFIVGYVGIFIHGNPPSHYYLPLYSIPIIIFSSVLFAFWRKPFKFLLAVIFGMILYSSLTFYFSDRWFYMSNNVRKNRYVPYIVQQAAVQSIIKNAHGEGYSIVRVGPNDEFEGYFAQNYQYLLWLNGNEPIQQVGESANQLIYTIYEDGTGIYQKDGEIVYKNGSLVIVKSM